MVGADLRHVGVEPDLEAGIAAFAAEGNEGRGIGGGILFRQLIQHKVVRGRAGDLHDDVVNVLDADKLKPLGDLRPVDSSLGDFEDTNLSSVHLLCFLVRGGTLSNKLLFDPIGNLCKTPRRNEH